MSNVLPGDGYGDGRDDDDEGRPRRPPLIRQPRLVTDHRRPPRERRGRGEQHERRRLVDVSLVLLAIGVAVLVVLALTS